MLTSVEFDFESMRSQLALMISKERRSGEFLLASVVQDSLLYVLHEHADSPTLMNTAQAAATAAIETTADVMYLNQFTVCESIRGVMHGMVTLGGDPVLITMAITIGALQGLMNTSQEHFELFSHSITRGITSAAVDMGLSPSKLHRVAAYLVENIGTTMAPSTAIPS